MVYLIDRRPNDRGKSAVNRERFLRRYKTHIQEAVKKMVGDRRLADMEGGGEVRVPKKDMSEPSFTFGRGGDREFVLPGNREYVAGDRIPRPEGGGGGGDGNDGGEGDSQDEFVFSLSREEFMQIFFDDLELPRLARTEFGRTHRHKSIRAGFAKSRDMARQLVRHGHFTVNGRKVDIPSFRVREHDVIQVREKSRDLTPFLIAQGLAGSRPVPAWLEAIPSQLKILVHSLPARQSIDTQVQEQLIVELYSK